MPNATARNFLDAFLEAYSRCRLHYTREEWDLSVWPKWDYFLFRTKPHLGLRDESVLKAVAKKLDMDYWEGEPLRLDGVFHRKGGEVAHGFPFPILVAIEHEEAPHTFGSEIMKLLTVRCPLKVGITYDCGDAGWRKRIQDDIAEKFQAIAAVNSEDPHCEYLFLIGCFENREAREPAWWSVQFSAGSGLNGTTFEPVQ